MTEVQPAEDTSDRIEANYSACMGSGLCSYIAPAHFDVVDGTVTILDQTVSDSNRSVVDEAVESCPTQALRIKAARPA